MYTSLASAFALYEGYLLAITETMLSDRAVSFEVRMSGTGSKRRVLYDTNLIHYHVVSSQSVAWNMTRKDSTGEYIY
jgi:hypothetical protein